LRSAGSHAINPGAVLAPPPPSHRKRVHRRVHLASQSLEPTQRLALLDRLYAVYNDTLHGYSLDEFEHLVFGADDVRFALFYGTGDELAGFSFAGIDRIDHAGRTYAVMGGGGFFRSRYRGGALASLFMLGQALRVRAQEPQTPLAYLTRATTPAAYRRLAATMPRIYPSRERQTPAYVDALVRTMSARRQYVAVDGNPWLVRSAAPHDPARLRSLDRDPDVQFYLELNPAFAEGNSVLVWTCGDAADLASGFARALRGRLTR
jgi:hypothetical protein